jgi:hypothetical protein
MIEPHCVATIIFCAKTIVALVNVAKHQGPGIVAYKQAIDALANQYIELTHH